MGFVEWLNKPAPIPGRDVDTFSSSLASMIVSTELQTAWTSAKALSVAAIFRARQMNADTLSSLPVKAGDSLVTAPNRDQDTQEFVAETVLSMQDAGEAYWSISPKGELKVLDHGRMVVTWNPDRTRRIYTYENRVLRATGFGPNLVVIPMNRGAGDRTGNGPLQSKRIAGLIAEQEYSQEYFENNAQHTGALTHPGVLTGKEAKVLYDQWMLGQENRTTGVLSGGMDYKPLSFNPQDSEWVNTHLVGVGDVATLFGVPSSLLNYNQPGSSITYQSVGSVYEGYWRQTLAPTYARRIERAWGQVLGNTVRFDPEELFLASLRERGEVTAALVAQGFDPADAADVSGLPPMKHTGKVNSDVADV